LEDDIFTVLEYGLNDVMPDPFSWLTEVNNKNIDIWIKIMVNYCFRWVFGIGDTARRNLMLQKSTGKIYSTDETGIEIVNHDSVWGGKKPGKKTFLPIREFVKSSYFDSVVYEVGRWREYLEHINHDIVPLSALVQGRIDKLLKHPTTVFDV